MTAGDAELIDILFEPVRLGSMVVPNRIAMAPMTREFSPGGVPGPDVVNYYRRRADGGAGLIITEGMAVNPVGAHDGPIPLLFQKETIAACAELTSAVHAAGSKIVAQLWHVGVQDSPTEVNPTTIKQRPARVGPSGYSGRGEKAGDSLDREGISNTIADFAHAACAAQSAGFDGIEIHGAHGYLPDQFLWTRTNKRDDEFGGSIENRARFVAELVSACRAASGRDFPIILRVSQWKGSDYSARLTESPHELGDLLQPLVDAGVTAFHCSTRRFWEPGFEGSPLTLAGWIRKLTKTPVIAVGSVTLETDFKEGTRAETGGIAESRARSRDVVSVAELIRNGEFDMIAVGRAMISNPDWANIVRAGRMADLKPFAKHQLATLE